MIAVGVVCAVVLLVSWFLLFGSKPRRNDTSSTDNKVGKAVILSSDAKSFMQKYGFVNSYENDNAVTVCCSVHCFSMDGPDTWLSKLKTMSEVSKVFLLLEVNSSCSTEANADSSDIVLNSFRARLAGSKLETLIPPHRVLAYSTEIGKIAIVRQLKPRLHFESDPAVCVALNPHIHTVAHVRPRPGGEQESPAVKWLELDHLQDISMS